MERLGLRRPLDGFDARWLTKLAECISGSSSDIPICISQQRHEDVCGPRPGDLANRCDAPEPHIVMGIAPREVDDLFERVETFQCGQGANCAEPRLEIMRP